MPVEDYVLKNSERDLGLQKRGGIALAGKRLSWFSAQILAKNATRWLSTYMPICGAFTDATTGRVLQLLGKQNHQAVWSQEAGQRPWRNKLVNRFVQAQGIDSGFFVQHESAGAGDGRTNHGDLLNDFAISAANRRSAKVNR